MIAKEFNDKPTSFYFALFFEIFEREFVVPFKKELEMDIHDGLSLLGAMKKKKENPHFRVETSFLSNLADVADDFRDEDQLVDSCSRLFSACYQILQCNPAEVSDELVQVLRLPSLNRIPNKDFLEFIKTEVDPIVDEDYLANIHAGNRNKGKDGVNRLFYALFRLETEKSEREAGQSKPALSGDERFALVGEKFERCIRNVVPLFKEEEKKEEKKEKKKRKPRNSKKKAEGGE